MRRNKLEAVQWSHPLALRRLAVATFTITLLVLMPQTASASELLTNGTFVTGLTGWNSYSTPNSGTWSTYSGVPVPGIPAPTAYGAITDLDSGQVGAHVLWQTFTAPTDGSTVTVSFDMFIWNSTPGNYNDFFQYYNLNPANYEAWVDILKPGANPQSDPMSDSFASVLRILYETPDGHTLPAPTAFTTVTSDITQYLTPGATYTLRFSEVNYTGAVYMGLQNVSVFAGTAGGGGTPPPTDGGGEAPEPGTLILIVSGCIAFSIWRRKTKTAAATA
jgi:hypothetical protein